MTHVRMVLVFFLFSGLAGAAAEEAEKDPEEITSSDSKEVPLQIYDEVEVRARRDDLVGIASSATEGVTGFEDLRKRTILRPGALAEAAPGVIATQHSGGGKANQYFLRGFNLDHGTDFSVWVAGVPVNMPSHGHGQGYADLNFLIPELVESVRYRKGPYFAERGDFSAAGGVDMHLFSELPHRIVSLTGGSYEFGRALWADGFQVSGGELVAAVDVFHNNGPWERDEDYDGAKGLLRYSRGDAGGGFSVTAMAYDGSWLSTDQVPRRQVDSGQVDRFGLIDSGPRGSSERYSLSAEAHRGRANALTRLGGYLLYSDFHLISNFTYFLDDEENGDQFEQADERFVAGLEVSRHWMGSWGEKTLETSAGIRFRADDIDNGIFGTRDLARIGTVRQDRIFQLTGGPWAETLVKWSDRIRTRFGLRADYYRADVASDLEANSGDEDDVQLSPKLSLILGPWKHMEVYFNAGFGFHSNDARGATIRVDPATGQPVERVQPLVRARGADVGFRTTALPGLQTTVSVFVLDLDSELLFVGDGGATEASRPSRRFGVEWTNHYEFNDRLSLELDVTWTDSKFTDDDPAGDHIPGAIRNTVAAGLSLANLGNFSTSLRWRYFAEIPLVEDGSVSWSSSSLVTAQIGYDFPSGFGLALEIVNLFDRDDSDVEYYYASRLPGEPVGGVEDIHFHPLEKRSIRLVAAWRR